MTLGLTVSAIKGIFECLVLVQSKDDDKIKITLT